MNGLGVLLGLIAGVAAIVMALTAYLIHNGMNEPTPNAKSNSTDPG